MELLKKYSTLDEVLLYLRDKTGYDYKLDDIYQLEIEEKIEAYLYLTEPRIRLEKIDTDGNSSYDFRYIPLKGIYKKMHRGSIFSEGGVLADEINIDSCMLNIHELLEEYYLDKIPTNPIPYDENYVFFDGFDFFKDQNKLRGLLRFDSEQVKGLINFDVEKQNITSQLKIENEKLRADISKLKACEPVESQGYLDPNNRFFSIEMKLCHDTWNELYRNGNKSSLPHGQLASNYLKNYPDFTVNTKAIERITTITNPKARLAGTTAKEDL